VSQAAPAASGRDYRLDFFRGLALWFIFLDHLPENPLQWLTVRNFGFADATEIFIFISGYSAALAYGGTMQRRGMLLASAGIYRRCWQIYVAHIVLFVLFTGHVAYISVRFNNPMFAEELNVTNFLQEPHIALMQAMLLKFRPVNLDVLPLYIVLLAAFPPVLWALQRYRWSVLMGAFILYLIADRLRWNLPTYPGDGVWFFNPLCWQLLFIIGALCSSHPELLGRLRRFSMPLTWIAVAYMLFAAFIVSTWSWPQLAALVPDRLNRLMYPIDKTNMDALRLLHFLALAYLVMRLVPRGSAWLGSRWLKPAIWCGQQSLQIFCLGIFLSMVGHFLLAERPERLAIQVAVGLSGVLLMVGAAFVITWYKGAQKTPTPKLLTPA